MEGIIIVGYGRMGKEIEQQAAQMGISVCAVADNRRELEQLGVQWQVDRQLKAGRIAIEFTGGTAAIENLEYLLKHDIPIVCGSTPWNEQSHAEILKLRSERQGYLMLSSNYSIGVNIFWRVVRETSRLMNRFPHYDLGIYEQHHNKKADSPSGTAVSAGNIVLQEVERKIRLLYGKPQDAQGHERPIDAAELQVSSQRLGHIWGVHQLLCDSPEDSITISHQAHNRTGLARGTLIAAQFLQQQVDNNKPGFFSMGELMDYFLQS